jgi:hypothetical protein
MLQNVDQATAFGILDGENKPNAVVIYTGLTTNTFSSLLVTPDLKVTALNDFDLPVSE